MVVQLDEDGPSVETYRSSLYEVSVGGTPVYVYSRERNEHWLVATSVERSFAKWGANEDVEVEVSLASASPITSCAVYPPVVTPVIAAGVATLTIPPGVDLLLEINGDRLNTLMLFSRPVKSALPVTYTDWSELALDVASVDFGLQQITFSAAHGLTTGDLIVPNQDAGELADEVTLLGLSLYQRLRAVVISATVIELRDENNDDTVLLTDNGTSLALSFWKCSHDDAASALYFGPGLHVIGRSFTLVDNVTIYLDRGAVVVGGLNLKERDGVVVRGPGMFTGEFATFEGILNEAFETRATYAIFDGLNVDRSYYTNTVAEVTVMLTPFYLTTTGVCLFEGVQFISPWTPNTDAFVMSPNNVTEKLARVANCFSFCGDDNMHIQYTAHNRTCTGTFLVNTQGAAVFGGYHPGALRTAGIATTVQDVDILTYADQLNDNVGGVIKCWSDGWSSQLNNGNFDCSLTDVRVYGPVGIRLIDIRNRAYPWGADVRQQYGQIAFWTFTRLTCAEDPDELSLIQGRDEISTPHDLAFVDCSIGGVTLTNANYGTYITVDDVNVYNLTFGTDIVVPEVVTDASALWAAISASYPANDLIALTNLRARAATEALTASGVAAAQSVIDLWPIYAQAAYDPDVPAQVEVAKRAVIALLWSRGGTSQAIAKVEWDEVFGDSGLIAKVRQTGARGRQAPVTQSPYEASTGLSGNRTVRPWSDPDNIPHGLLPNRKTSRFV